MSTSVYNKYPPDSTFGGKKVLNAGCGFAKFAAFNVVNLDAFDLCKPNVVWDLNQTPLPFEDETFDLVIANHILEHLEDFWATFQEFARILKQNGRMEVYLPASGSDGAMGFRDHLHEINHCSFFGTFGTSRGQGNAWSEMTKDTPALWMKLVGTRTFVENYWWLNVWPFTHLRKFAATHLRNTVREIGYSFRKVTDEEFRERYGTRIGKNSKVLKLPKTAVSEQH